MLSNRPALLAAIAALIVTGAIAAMLLRVPLPFQDNTLLTLPLAPSARALFVDTMNQAGFMRPASRAASKLVFDAAPGAEFLAFRAVHIAMIGLLLVGSVRLLRVQDALGASLALVALAGIVGMPAFHEAVRETDLNIKLIVPAWCVGVAVLAAGDRPRWYRDAAALALLALGVLANELGLLLWVAMFAAHLVGFRGISRRGIVLATIIVAAYLGARFLLLDVGAPALTERGSGFGLRTMEPAELMARFGDNPLPYYAYNVAASAMSVVFSEPRGGVFVLVRQLRDAAVASGTVLNVVTSVLSTGVLVWYAVQRSRYWIARDLTHGDRLFLVAAAVIAANAVISYPYLKDVTMSTGAAFYPLALFAALHHLLSQAMVRPVALSRAASVCLLAALLSVGWTLRGAAFAVDMRVEGWRLGRDWVAVYERLAEQGTPAAEIDRPFTDRFRGQMLALPGTRAGATPSWLADLDPH